MKYFRNESETTGNNYISDSGLSVMYEITDNIHKFINLLNILGHRHIVKGPPTVQWHCISISTTWDSDIAFKNSALLRSVTNPQHM